MSNILFLLILSLNIEPGQAANPEKIRGKYVCPDIIYCTLIIHANNRFHFTTEFFELRGKNRYQGSWTMGGDTLSLYLKYKGVEMPAGYYYIPSHLRVKANGDTLQDISSEKNIAVYFKIK
ncbi:MAG TPA: hypothetical protein VE978_19590 [Chitinophagales bacterium]|nr:hypothetical protein [Chitinophagales bacterium]